MRIRAEQRFQGLHGFFSQVEHAGQCRVGPLYDPFGVQINHPGGNVFQDRFHKLAAALEFLHGQLEI
ncbi:MAG TPA: hypothetical protein VEL75_00230, partial [Candidatus Methylomirabilis sp.]|nr:hypothetical protein [Candidatus Methylomirabilis sp.]